MSSSLARVMPTKNRRRSSSTSVSAPGRAIGRRPSATPARKTTGNSRPFAPCSVISVTAPASRRLAVAAAHVGLLSSIEGGRESRSSYRGRRRRWQGAQARRRRRAWRSNAEAGARAFPLESLGASNSTARTYSCAPEVSRSAFRALQGRFTGGGAAQGVFAKAPVEAQGGAQAGRGPRARRGNGRTPARRARRHLPDIPRGRPPDRGYRRA